MHPCGNKQFWMKRSAVSNRPSANHLFLKALADRWSDVEETGDVAVIVDHIEHVAAVGGVDHVGLGSDFDGVDLLPEGLEDVSCYPNITTELLRRGWEEPDIRKILGENAVRVLAAVEAAAE